MSKLLEIALEDLSPGTSQFNVLLYLAFKGPSQPREISDDTGISPGTVRPALRALLSKKYLAQLEDGSYQSKITFTDILSDIYARFKEKE
jgi:DNA-binding MarR family transcriptional regulator